MHLPPTVSNTQKDYKEQRMSHISESLGSVRLKPDESIPQSVVKLHNDILTQIKNELVLDIKADLKDEIAESPFRSAKMKLQ